MVILAYKWLAVCSLWFVAGTSGPATSSSKPSGPHPFYVSVTEMHLNNSDHTLEISCKMFSDDLENVIEKNNNTQLDISAEKDKPQFDKFIPAYIRRHLSVSVDGKPVSLSYLGFEIEKESAYCYLQVENIASFKKIDVSNSLLHDLTPEQINILHITVNGKRQSVKLDYPVKSASFNF